MKSFAWLVAVTVLISNVLIWLPFIINLSTFWTIPLPGEGLATVVSNFDGPYYIVVAKSWYQSDSIKTFEFPLSVEYYAAHFPLYPLTISLLALIVNYPYAMIISTTISAIMAHIMFYQLCCTLKCRNPMLLTLVFLILPARWVITRAVGSPEPQFVFLTLWAIDSYLKGKFWQAGIAGALAQLTKPPGALLAIAMVVAAVPKLIEAIQKKDFKILPWEQFPLVLIPLSLAGLFTIYAYTYGSFMAYFQSGDNIHLFWPPFQVFNRNAFWVGTFWLEDIIYLYLFFFMAISLMGKLPMLIKSYLLIFVLSIVFVSHRDIARYALPVIPLVLIALEPLINQKQTKYIILALIIPVYLFTINYIAGNTTPISDWQHLL